MRSQRHPVAGGGSDIVDRTRIDAECDAHGVHPSLVVHVIQASGTDHIHSQPVGGRSRHIRHKRPDGGIGFQLLSGDFVRRFDIGRKECERLAGIDDLRLDFLEIRDRRILDPDVGDFVFAQSDAKQFVQVLFVAGIFQIG